MIGAVVNTPPHFHRILSSLGPKLYFFTSNSKETTQQDILDDYDLDDFEIRKQLVHDSVISYPEATDQMNTLSILTKDEKFVNIMRDFQKDLNQRIDFAMKLRNKF